MRGLERLKSVNRETTASVIAARLRARVMDGTFPPGYQIGETQLASRQSEGCRCHENGRCKTPENTELPDLDSNQD